MRRARVCINEVGIMYIITGDAHPFVTSQMHASLVQNVTFVSQYFSMMNVHDTDLLTDWSSNATVTPDRTIA